MDESASKPAAAALTREMVIGRRVLLHGLPTSSFHNERSGICVAESTVSGHFVVEVITYFISFVISSAMRDWSKK
jgi:hypothetical protein